MTIIANNKNLINVDYIPPDGGWGWVVVISSLIIHFIMDGITYSLGTYLTNFIQQFNITRSEASIVHALLPAITLSCGPISSIFTNKFGCRKTTIFGTLIASLGFFLSFFVTKFYYLYITIGLVVGIGFGIIYVPAIVSVGYYFEKKRSLAIGIAVCGSGFGTFVLSPINRILVDNYGINGAFLIKSAFVLNLVICGMLQSKEQQNDKKENNKLLDEKITESLPTVYLHKIDVKEKENNYLSPLEDPMEFAKSLPMLNENNTANTLERNSVQKNSKIHRVIKSEEEEESVSKIKDFLDFSLLKDPVFIFFSISNFLTSLGFNAPFIYIVDQADSIGIPTKHGDYFLATIGISNTVGRVVLGIISDVKGVNRLYLYATVLTICGIATSIEPFFTTYAGFLIYSMVFGFTSGGYVSLTSVLLVDLLGLDKLTNAFGMLLVFQGIATLIGPPTIGILYDIFKSYSIPFFLIGILIGLSGFMCFFIPLLKKEKTTTIDKISDVFISFFADKVMNDLIKQFQLKQRFDNS
ncbi:monocarboxylate transporter 12 [Brachionus plicatilis]|uniref:Monocarboxylate transporter 12 n=1 Tax=Brachionus plicatilis TaxID=10195 RepID=A0A3M7RMR6_BRAPC|nr:monocarboxylate transporter 12 [Brachionus plicatilis]